MQFNRPGRPFVRERFPTRSSVSRTTLQPIDPSGPVRVSDGVRRQSGQRTSWPLDCRPQSIAGQVPGDPEHRNFHQVRGRRLRAPSRPNFPRATRLVGAFAIVLEPMAHNGSLLETNDEWAVARRYMSLETLARVTDNPNIRPPAVAA